MSLKPGSGRRRRTCILGDRVADLGVGHILDGRGKEANLTGRQLLNLDRLGRQYTDRLHIEYPAIGHEPDPRALAQDAIDHAGQHDHATIRIKPAIEDQGLQGRFRVSCGRRQTVHDGFQHLGNAKARFGTHREAHR